MKEYEVVMYTKYTGYEKMWVRVSAETEDDAMEAAKRGDYEVDESNLVDTCDEIPIDFENWRAYEIDQ